MAVIALRPKRGYSFTGHALANPAAPPPGDRLDSEVDRIDRVLGQIVDFLSVSLNSDGTLKASPTAAAAPGTESPAVLGPQSGTHIIAGADPNAQAQDWAEVSAEWAEHMPGTIPPNILAVMGVTGDHWSARWWANRALEIVAEASGGLGVFVGDTPPASPGYGALWWDSVGGQLYLWYDDFTSSQWVSATSPVVLSAVPVPLLVLAPASGDTVVLASVRPVYVNNPGLLAALTIRLPPVVVGNRIEIGFRSAVTTLSWQNSAGAVLPGLPAAAQAPGHAIELRFDAPGWIYWK